MSCSDLKRIKSNKAILGELMVNGDYPLLFVEAQIQAPKQPKPGPLPTPREKVALASKVEAAKAVTAIARYERLPGSQFAQPKQPCKMEKVSDKWEISTVKEFLTLHAGYVECCPDNLEALSGTMPLEVWSEPSTATGSQEQSNMPAGERTFSTWC